MVDFCKQGKNIMNTVSSMNWHAINILQNMCGNRVFWLSWHARLHHLVTNWVWSHDTVCYFTTHDSAFWTFLLPHFHVYFVHNPLFCFAYMTKVNYRVFSKMTRKKIKAEGKHYDKTEKKSNKKGWPTVFCCFDLETKLIVKMTLIRPSFISNWSRGSS